MISMHDMYKNVVFTTTVELRLVDIPWKADTSIMWTLLNVPMINLSYSTNVNFPLKWGHPYNQDTFLVPKGVHITGVPLYVIM